MPLDALHLHFHRRDDVRQQADNSQLLTFSAGECRALVQARIAQDIEAALR